MAKEKEWPGYAVLARGVREAYDKGLDPRGRAVLRRCKTPAEVLLEGAFWRIVDDVPDEQRERFAPVVWCFGGAEASRRTDFRLGSHLRRRMAGDSGAVGAGDARRFRRLVVTRDLGGLCMRLRRLLVHAGGKVDWGVVGSDLIFWGLGGEHRDRVLRLWAREFYATAPRGATSDEDDTTSSESIE